MICNAIYSKVTVDKGNPFIIKSLRVSKNLAADLGEHVTLIL